MNQPENLCGYTIEELRRLIQEGLDSGPAIDGPSAMSELKAKYENSGQEKSTS